MGDSRRFQVFSGEVAKHFSKQFSIADVAGGKGYMRLAMSELGFKNVETWDKRYSHIPGNQKYKYFEWDKAPAYDGVIGMHPDEGTDHIIHYCAKHKVKGLVCPCCIKSSAEVFWGRRKYNDWKSWLNDMANRLNLNVEWAKMPFNGRNDLMIISPN